MKFKITLASHIFYDDEEKKATLLKNKLKKLGIKYEFKNIEYGSDRPRYFLDIDDDV